jgi:hypothetical protein
VELIPLLEISPNLTRTSIAGAPNLRLSLSNRTDKSEAAGTCSYVMQFLIGVFCVPTVVTSSNLTNLSPVRPIS